MRMPIPVQSVHFRRRIHSPLLVTLTLLAFVPPAFAVPSFSRQTGDPCTQCHVQAFGPTLTEFGRDFKLNGYVLGSGDSTRFSAMMISTFASTSKDLPYKAADHYDDNDNFAVNEVGLFYAGKITNHIGTFTQVTWEGIPHDDHDVSWDNFDTRYANTLNFGGHNAVVGVSVNNSPTVQDLWNSTPVWGFPSVGSDLAPAPGAGPLISDGLGQQVLGVTAYTMIDNHLYLEAGAYKSLPNDWLDHLAGTSLDSPRASGLIPYARATWQLTSGANYFSAGLLTMQAELDPDASVGDKNKYTDYGIDAMYQYLPDSDQRVSASFSYITENQELNQAFLAQEADGASSNLDSLHVNVDYVWRETWSASVGWFDTQGTHDYTMYAPDPVEGSASGSPDSRGYILQLEYIPWGKAASWMQPNVNLRVGVQYTGYERFNGGDGNYDGFGRSASDNDTLLLFVWLAV